MVHMTWGSWIKLYCFTLILKNKERKNTTSSSNHEGPKIPNPKVIDPIGNVVYNSHDENISRKFELRPSSGGVYLFCFINSSPHRLLVQFDLNVLPNTGDHLTEYAKDVHFELLKLAVDELKYARQNIVLEQEFLISQMKDQSIINKKMSKRAINKAVYC